MPLTDTEISGIRACFESETLQDTVTISRRTDSPDGQGGKTGVWANIATVAGRIGPGQRGASGAEGSIADRVGGATPIILNLPAHTDITLRDRAAFHDHQTAAVRVLEVVALDAPRSWEFTRQVTCQEIT
jgi:head-tail adaptor